MYGRLHKGQSINNNFKAREIWSFFVDFFKCGICPKREIRKNPCDFFRLKIGENEGADILQIQAFFCLKPIWPHFSKLIY